MDQMPPRFRPPPSPDMGPPRPVAFYPLDINRVIQLTFSLFRFRWRLFIGIALAVLIPVAVAQGLLQVVTLEAISRWTQETIRAVQSGASDPDEILALIPYPQIALSYVAAILMSVISFLVVAAITGATASLFMGGRPTIGGSLRGAARKLRPVAVVFLVPFLVYIALILGGGTLAALLVLANITNGTLQPGLFVFLALVLVVALIAVTIFLGVRWVFAVPAVMIENARGLQALGRSWRLVSGSSWRVLGYLLLFGFLVGLPAGLVAFAITAMVGSGMEQTAAGIVTDPFQAFLSTALTGVAVAVFAPITTIGMTILYFDIRARHGERVPAPGETPPTPEAPPTSEESGASEASEASIPE